MYLVIFRVYFVFGKFLNLLWKMLYAIEQIFIDENGPILENNIDFWSHWTYGLSTTPTIRLNEYPLN